MGKALFILWLDLLYACGLVKNNNSNEQTYNGAAQGGDNAAAGEAADDIANEAAGCYSQTIGQLSGYVFDMVAAGTCGCHDGGIGDG